MDISDYRKDYEEKLKRASREGSGYRKSLQQKGGASSDFLFGAGVSGESAEDDAEALVNLAADSAAPTELRSAALQASAAEIGRGKGVTQMALDILADPSQPGELRLKALESLQASTFSSLEFTQRRPEYMATLRGLVEDKDRDVRHAVIEILAAEKDEYVQRRLLDGLQGKDKELVGKTKAIQLLGYDLHAEHYPILQQIVEEAPSRSAKREAVRLLAADPSSTEILSNILADKSEHVDVRKASANALQAVAPNQLAQQARQMVFDEDEDEDLRTLSIAALNQVVASSDLDDDADLNAQVEQLEESAKSKNLKKASSSYLSKRAGYS